MQSTLTFLILLLVLLAIAAWLGYRGSKRTKEQLRKRFAKEFGGVPSKRMPPERYRNVPGFFRRHRASQALDDITWNDLDMDSVFRRIDSTKSAAGEEYLYYALRSPALKAEELPVRRESLQFLGDEAHRDTRITFELLLHDLGSTGKYSLLDYLDRLDELGTRSNARHYVCLLLPLICIGITFVNVPVGIVLLVAVLIFNMLTYLEQKREVEPYIVSFRYLLRLLKADEKIAAVPVQGCKPLEEDEKSLQKELQKFTSFRRGSFMLMSGSGTGNPLDIVMDYVRMLFHLDLIKFNQMLQQVTAHRGDIDTLLTITGRIDTEIAAASFRKSLPFFCLPSLDASALNEAGTANSAAASLRIKDLFHPLLKKPIANSIAADRPVLLTGSNASGKSTFLKAVALCALLGQSLDTVCARQYQAPYYRIYSSMALRDNIQAGDSYFMVEIKSLKRIMDAAEDRSQTAPVLCFIDEVLRGTNTIERIAASSEILETFARAGAMVFAATHDIELAELLDGPFANYHFEETLQDDPETGRQDVLFSYEIQPGKAHTRNAIRLLAAAGFDPSVTDKAEERAVRFEKTGEWV